MAGIQLTKIEATKATGFITFSYQHAAAILTVTKKLCREVPKVGKILHSWIDFAATGPSALLHKAKFHDT